VFVRACVHHLCVVPVSKCFAHIIERKCAQTLSCLIEYKFFPKMGRPEVRRSTASSRHSHTRFLLLCPSFKTLFSK